MIITKGQSLTIKIMKLFEKEEILLQHSVLSYRIDLYFPKHKLAIEFDENGHKGRNIDYEIKRQKTIEKQLDCEFIRFNPDREDYYEYVE